MKIGDINYFSKNFRFRDINWYKKDVVIKAFKDRVEGLYLEPAEELKHNHHPFATGIMCVTTIDFIARIETGLKNCSEKRFENWLKENIKDFAREDPEKRPLTLARRFYKEFRCGLVHEGRIKSGGLFSYEIAPLVVVDDGIMVVNPNKLLTEVKEVFKRYIKKIKNNKEAFKKLQKVLMEDFEPDIKQTKNIIQARNNIGKTLESQMIYSGTH